MAKTKEELNTLKKECEALTNKLQDLSENELKLVTGGEGTTTYKYVFTNKDWVYENSMKTINIAIQENVSTNDGSRKIRCIKRSSVPELLVDYRPEIYYSASTLLNCYKEYGGVLHAM